MPSGVMVGVVALQLLLLGAVCNKSDRRQENGPPSVVHSVEIVPPVTHAAPGTQFQLDALARDVARVPLGNQPPSRWSGGVFSSATANPTIVTAPDHTVSDIRVRIDRVNSPPASIIVTPRAGDVVDHLTVQHGPNGPVAAVLIDAMAKGSDCGNDLLYRVAGGAMLDRNLTSGCPNKLAVFAVDHAVLFECQRPTAGATDPQQHAEINGSHCNSDLENVWTDEANTVTRDPLPNPLDVKLIVWYRVHDAAPESEGVIDVSFATAVYRLRRAGMVFRIEPGAGGSNGSVRTYTPLDSHCTGVEDTLGFAIQTDALNVVYVQEILFGEDASVRGLTCNRPTGAPVVIISWTRKAPSTLAHEVAHVMGLSSQILTEFPWGHTTYLPEFDESNLMWAQENATVGVERDHLSLGQVFRLHVDERSWANRAGNIRSGDRELCQAKRSDSIPCPKLHRDVGEP